MAVGQGGYRNKPVGVTACDPPVLRTELHGNQFCQFKRTVRQTGLLKLSLELILKKSHFPVFAKHFRKQARFVMPKNVKSQITAPYSVHCYVHCRNNCHTLPRAEQHTNSNLHNQAHLLSELSIALYFTF